MKSKSLPISMLAILFVAISMAFCPEIAAKGNSKKATSDLGWYSRGPINIAGSVRAILIDKQDATQKTLIIGSEMGGLWRSVDGGTNWSRINYEANLSVSSLAQTANGDIYIGTTDVAYEGSCLYRMVGNNITPVEGSNWTTIGSIATQNNNLFLATIEGLKFYDGNTFTNCSANGTALTGEATEVEVNSAGIIIASVNNKCYISEGSTDGFISQHGTNALPTTGLGSVAVASDNTNPNLFYVSIAKVNGALNGIFATFDKGATWEVILQGGGSIDPFVYNKVKLGLDNNKIFSYNGKEGYNALYVACHDLWFGYRPIDGTGFFDFGTQSVTSSGTDYNSPLYLHSYVYDIAYTNANSAYIVTEGGVYSSEQFEPMSGAIFFRKHNITLSNAMITHIDADGNNFVLCGTKSSGPIVIGKGVNAITLGKPVWTLASSSDYYSLEGSSIFNFASVICQDFYLNSSINDNVFQMRRSDNNGYTYSVMSVVNDMDAGVSDLIYWETFDAKYTMDTTIFHAYVDTDTTTSTHYNNWAPGDVVWAYSKHKYDNSEKFPISYTLDRQLNVGDSVIFPDPIQSRTFTAKEKKIYMTDRILDVTVGEPSWKVIATAPKNVYKLGLSANCEDLYFSTEAGKLYRIADIDAYYIDSVANAFEEIADFSGANVNSICVDPLNRDKVVVVTSEDIFLSNNATAEAPTFNSIKGSLPNTEFNTAYIPKNGENSSNLILVGTMNGLFTYENGTWTRDEVIGDIPVTSIKQQNLVRKGVSIPMRNPNPTDTINTFVYKYFTPSTNNGSLYVGTLGKGVYQSDIYKTAPVVSISEMTNEEAATMTVYPNPVQSTANIEIEAATAQEGLVQVFDIQGRCIMTQTVQLQSGTNVQTLDFSNCTNGIYLVRVICGQQSHTAKIIKNF